MKIVEKDDNTKVTLSKVEAGDVFEWEGEYLIKVERDENYGSIITSVNLANGILEKIPLYVEVTPVKAALIFE